ncbi:hypothetical protein [Altererythrobacter sp. TH136]|uniref:hypothetical protein n=1 Tax=Altererythrobacter sp. TH136 TaxID=2067415 RepID=UPI001161DD09|nr:hypothetical protein [Altererythrobacter sp. TH136]QDM40955.1 hypothetical protein C0V74_07880 [Altererythrobacter sp. TH136]
MSDTPKRKPATQPPVSAHPAFPVIVGLWFAALFGIGSMVLPIDLFERFAVSSGLAGVYASAQPPLGATAPIVVALSAAIAGALAGLFVARRIAAAHAPHTATRRAAALRAEPEPGEMSAKRPISAHEELGEGGLDEELETPRDAPRPRRRSLAVAEESARSDFLSFAPLPGQDPHASPEPLDLIAFDEPPAEPESEGPEVAKTGPFGTATLSAPPPAAGHLFQPLAPETAAEPDDERPAFLSRERTEERRAEPAPTAASVNAVPAHAVPVGDRPLAELGVVELVERFAQALERHKAVVAADAPAPVLLPAQGEADTVPVSDRDTANLPHQPFAIPAALQPFGFDEQDEEDDLPDLDLTAALSRGRGDAFAAIAEAHDESDEMDEIEDAADAGYTSLLAMKSPFGLPREPVRIEDEAAADDDGIEPVVMFPGQTVHELTPAPLTAAGRPFDAPLQRAQAAVGRVSFGQPGGPATRDPGETERALREALEKLQRLSGAA